MSATVVRAATGRAPIGGACRGSASGAALRSRAGARLSAYRIKIRLQRYAVWSRLEGRQLCVSPSTCPMLALGLSLEQVRSAALKNTQPALVITPPTSADCGRAGESPGLEETSYQDASGASVTNTQQEHGGRLKQGVGFESQPAYSPARLERGGCGVRSNGCGASLVRVQTLCLRQEAAGAGPATAHQVCVPATWGLCMGLPPLRVRARVPVTRTENGGAWPRRYGALEHPPTAQREGCHSSLCLRPSGRLFHTRATVAPGPVPVAFASARHEPNRPFSLARTPTNRIRSWSPGTGCGPALRFNPALRGGRQRQLVRTAGNVLS
jgi:hypothetical protein